MRQYRTQPETDALAAKVKELADSVARIANRTAPTNKLMLERAEDEARQMSAYARDLRMALRGELQRVRAEERAIGRERVVALVGETASIGEVLP